MNKREFMMSGGALLAVSPAGALAGPTPVVATAGSASAGHWRAAVGSEFQVIDPPGSAALRLARIHAPEVDARLEQFTLVFSASGAGALPAAGMVSLQRAGETARQLHLSEAGFAPDGARLLRADCAHRS